MAEARFPFGAKRHVFVRRDQAAARGSACANLKDAAGARANDLGKTLIERVDRFFDPPGDVEPRSAEMELLEARSKIAALQYHLEEAIKRRLLFEGDLYGRIELEKSWVGHPEHSIASKKGDAVRHALDRRFELVPRLSECLDAVIILFL